MQTQHFWRNCYLLLCGMFLLTACAPPDAPTPTRLPHEPATIYAGTLRDEADQAVGEIALVISTTRVRALVCSEHPTLWSMLSGWLPNGTVNAETLRTDNAATGAFVDAARREADWYGEYTAVSDSTARVFNFQAARLITPEQIAAGGQEGVYWLDGDLPGELGKARLWLLVMDATNAPNQEAGVCGVLLRDERPLSRVAPSGPWQQGIGAFLLTDLPDKDGTPMQWQLPGRLGQIDSIGYAPTATPAR